MTPEEMEKEIRELAENFFDIKIPKEQQPELLKKIQSFIFGKKDAVFDANEQTFKGGGVEGNWFAGQNMIRVYITKKPWLVPMGRIEKAIREFIA